MQYPSRIHIKPYRGSKPERQRQWQDEIATANRIADWLNTKLSSLPEGTVTEFDYYEIASDLGIDKATVKRILFANGGGSNGITLRR